VGHYRRYGRTELLRKLAEQSFEVTASFYLNWLGFFAWFVNSRVLHNTPRTGLLVEKQAMFFDRHCVGILRRMEAAVRPPFGQSIICVAEKRGGCRCAG
jgi:hypothetical protein